jgi:Adenylate and Guanylate cyclase catalytic domain
MRAIQVGAPILWRSRLLGISKRKLLVNEQREVVEQLNRTVRKTPQFRKSEGVGKLIRIPVGDGMALVFFQTPEEPVQCAMEIARALRNHPRIRLRMGVHSGPIDQVKDVNDRLNVAGAGINMAQRVMACGDAGHILLSKRVAEDLAQDKLWQPHLHELGEIEVKHGRKLGIVNLYSEEIGNPMVPEKLKGPSRQPVERPVRLGWPRLIKIATLFLVCLLAAVAVIILCGIAELICRPGRHSRHPRLQEKLPLWKKVLPFCLSKILVTTRITRISLMESKKRF